MRSTDSPFSEEELSSSRYPRYQAEVFDLKIRWAGASLVSHIKSAEVVLRGRAINACVTSDSPSFEMDIGEDSSMIKSTSSVSWYFSSTKMPLDPIYPYPYESGSYPIGTGSFHQKKLTAHKKIVCLEISLISRFADTAKDVQASHDALHEVLLLEEVEERFSKNYYRLGVGIISAAHNLFADTVSNRGVFISITFQNEIMKR
jgi:hypothetical protein